MSTWNSEKKTVLEAAQRMAQEGYVVGTAGNVSMRLDEPGGRGLVAITPNDRYYDNLTVDDIVVVDFDGQQVEGELKTSVETMLHIGIYKARKKVNAVMHVHPVYASIVAVTGLGIPPILEDQVTYLGGEIKIAQYALSGTDELAKNVISALGANNAVLLANHGALSVGRNMKEAYTNCAMLEKTAKIYVYARNSGTEIRQVPAEPLAVMQAFFNYHHGDS